MPDVAELFDVAGTVAVQVGRRAGRDREQERRGGGEGAGGLHSFGQRDHGKSYCHSPQAAVSSWKRKSEGRKQRAEGRGQKAEGRRQKAEVHPFGGQAATS